MNEESKRREYARAKRRINILAGVTFVGVTGAFFLTATQVFNASWREWWVGVGGLSFGFAIGLAVNVAMEYTLDRKYGRVDLSLWKYVRVSLRFLLVTLLIPAAIALAIGILVTTRYEGPLRWLLVRASAFIVAVLYAGLAFPYLLRRVTDAERAGRRIGSLANDIAERLGVTIQGVYKVPLEGLRTANAAQVGFLEGRKSVFVLGEWEKHFTKDEIRAVLAHEFAHAKHNHIRKLLIVQVLCRLGVPGLLFLSAYSLARIFEVPRPAPTGIVLAVVLTAVPIMVASYLFPAWVSRKYESQADLAAADVCGTDSTMSALEKLAEFNMIPEERSHLLSTHPSIKDRVRALRAR